MPLSQMKLKKESNMHRQVLIEQIKQKQTYLCVGLDTDINKIPVHLRKEKDAILQFNKAIIDHTKDYCVSYKLNTAFYEALGPAGWEIMAATVDYIPDTHLSIADAKRADIGNTSAYYAKAFFESLNFDAITVAPYMGEDSLSPFLAYDNKWTIVLGLTSNPGAADFELQAMQTAAGVPPEMLYERVMRTVARWGNPSNLMFVAGATQASALSNIRQLLPNHFLLVPGVGFQGGSLKEVSEHGLIPDVGLLINASRAIIYASSNENFAEEAAVIAREYQTEMAAYLI